MARVRCGLATELQCMVTSNQNNLFTIRIITYILRWQEYHKIKYKTKRCITYVAYMTGTSGEQNCSTRPLACRAMIFKSKNVVKASSSRYYEILLSFQQYWKCCQMCQCGWSVVESGIQESDVKSFLILPSFSSTSKGCNILHNNPHTSAF